MIRKVNPADTPILVLGLTRHAATDHSRRLCGKHPAAKKYPRISGVGLVGLGGTAEARHPRNQAIRPAAGKFAAQLEDVAANVLGPGQCRLAQSTLHIPAPDLYANTNDHSSRPSNI